MHCAEQAIINHDYHVYCLKESQAEIKKNGVAAELYVLTRIVSGLQKGWRKEVLFFRLLLSWGFFVNSTLYLAVEQHANRRRVRIVILAALHAPQEHTQKDNRNR